MHSHPVHQIEARPLSDLYAPFIFWVLKLPDKLVAAAFTKLYLSPKSPNIHSLMRIAILLGKDFCGWLFGKWQKKWKSHPQPPNFYWTFKSFISKLEDSDLRLLAARVSPSTQFTIGPDESVAVKDLLKDPSRTEILLSRACMQVFRGDANCRSMARNLDYLAHATAVQKRASQLSKTIIKTIGDQLAGDAIETSEEE